MSHLVLTNPQLRVLHAVAEKKPRVQRVAFEYHLVEHVGQGVTYRMHVGTNVSKIVYALADLHILRLDYDGTIEVTVRGWAYLKEHGDSEKSKGDVAC